MLLDLDVSGPHDLPTFLIGWQVQSREQIENKTPRTPPKTVTYDAARG
jgi:hypothetical protein